MGEIDLAALEHYRMARRADDTLVSQIATLGAELAGLNAAAPGVLWDARRLIGELSALGRELDTRLGVGGAGSGGAGAGREG
jgi:hypothetical protein